MRGGGACSFVRIAHALPPPPPPHPNHSASRIGESDGDINRKRIKALRKALEPLGWKSIAAIE